MRKLWTALTKDSLFFQREFLFPLLCSALTLIGLAALAVLYCLDMLGRSLWFLALLALAVGGAAASLYYLYRVYIKVLARLDAKLVEKQPALAGQAQQNACTLADTLITALDAYDSVSAREYAGLLLHKQAQFDAMQSQINPHFLYNTLDSIRGKALEEGSAETADMLETLANLFRYSISSSADMVTVAEEIGNIDSFMRIQNYRFRDRFTLIKSIEQTPPGEVPLPMHKIPKLTLQPIIENAIYHGLADTTGEGIIRIHIYKTQMRLEISVSDNGVGIAGEKVDELNRRFLAAEYSTEDKGGKGGIALQNVNARIKFSFGDSYGLVAYSTPNIGTEFVVSLPVMEKQND